MRLIQDYNALSDMGYLSKDIPDYILNNLNPDFELREYQKEAIARFIHYLEKYPQRRKPSQLLFNMATGSGKTLLMASNILYLYNKGYRNFLFFVNSVNIIEKTKDNFLNHSSSKYLFNEKIKFEEKEIKINEVENFETPNNYYINILFTTVQGLHSYMNTPKENTLTYEDLKDKKIVMISDEAHHINAWTKNRLSRKEEDEKMTWENTVNKIFNLNEENVMLEYTATIDFDNSAIYDKYKDKIIYEYTLKQFRQDGYSKEVKVLQSDLNDIDRMLQSIVLSQYRRKIAERNRLPLKPVVLFKSRTIKESEENEKKFRKMIENLTEIDLQRVKSNAYESSIKKAFEYFEKQIISFDDLITELKEDFSKEKCILIDTNNIDKEKQLKLNSLEDADNEIRAIFVVDMLNEGWDVLNLFDIVRLYNTRDAENNRPGKTTISEAQLIGRGARYFPFKIAEEQDRFKRKFDQDPDNDLKIVEELYYHSVTNSRYITEITTALRSTGIMPPQEPKTLNLRVKEYFKNTELWKNGFVFINKKVEVDKSKIKDINDINIPKNFMPINIRTGFTEEKNLFIDEIKSEKVIEGTNVEKEKITRQFELNDFNENILKKAISKLDFYKFDNLQKYFPGLNSMNEFIKSLKQIRIDIRSSETRLTDLDPDDKVEICLNVLKQLKLKIIADYTDYKGSKLFLPEKIKDVVKDKTLNINVGDYSDQEFGIAMSETNKENLRLNLSDKNWYIYNENYGTSEEKYFIQFLNGMIQKLEKKYSEIYLLRNANLFKIYRFLDGRPIEPDFVLFLKENGLNKNFIQFQLFIEVKGAHLLSTDQWKADFLEEIEKEYKLQTLAENERYKLIGMPFYNESQKSIFIRIFNKKLNL